MTFKQETAVLTNSSKCDGCGAPVHFEPSTQTLKCDHCGSSKQIGDDHKHATPAEDYDTFLARIGTEEAQPGFEAVKCNNCGSASVLDRKINADKCPFCNSPLVVDLAGNKNYVSPHYVVPFKVSEQAAKKQFLTWLKGLSFAPSDLTGKVSGSSSPIDGVYLPYWIFDADAVTSYTGQRGDYYYTTEIYYERVDDEDVMRTREVRHTNWFPVLGTVRDVFTNVVVGASSSVPVATLQKIGNFDLTMMVGYDERYVTGFKAETFSLQPDKGVQQAADSMAPVIRNSIMNDIGGNEQRIDSTSTQLQYVKIKYVLMPIWISAYRYNNKTYQFAINGCTGKVSGNRPVSTWKIIRLILIILAIIAAIVLYFNYAA